MPCLVKAVSLREPPMIGKTISHYKILEKLGEGGMGVVYKAEDTKLDRYVALKFLSPRSLGTEEEMARFAREAKAAAALNHPNICTIHEIDDSDGQTFIAMEYVKGADLKTKIGAGPVELGDALGIAIQVSEGLAAAHKAKIVHRDIKPANIVVTPEGRAKIMDFGLARVAGAARLTRTGATVGTVAYASPEQARGGDIDHRTDIWSLGVVLYEMATGERPFRGDSDAAVIYSILNDEPESPSAARRGIPTSLDGLIERALAKDAAVRYQSADDFAADLIDLRGASESSIRTRQMDSITTEASIAVLPFADMSPDGDQEYFCDGMAEELINALANVEGLQVTSRTSAFQFKGPGHDIDEIGRKLKVQTVLEGSVRKAGTRLRITAQLVNVADGYHVWSERFDRHMEDIFAVQDEISLAIVDKLKVRLLGEEGARLVKRHTENLEAYNLYLRGRWLWNKRTEHGIRRAIEHFERAIEVAPDYAPAYAGVADAYNDLMNYSLSPPDDAYPKAEEAALRALELDGTLAEAHAALGFIKSEHRWDWEGAENEFKRAIELNPNYAAAYHGYAALMSYQGRFDGAVEAINRAIELDPLSLVTHRHMVSVLETAGQLDEALEAAKRAADLDPDYVFLHLLTGIVYIDKSMFDEALAEFELEERVEERAYGGRHPLVDAWTGVAYARSGRTNDAERILEDLKSRCREPQVHMLNIAQLCFLLDRRDEGFEWLERSYENHDGWLRYVVRLRRPYLAGDDPRLTDLLRRMGLER
jgi:serine/threonine protein kinase/tetratricopeptide (TPR) repeat protein